MANSKSKTADGLTAATTGAPSAEEMLRCSAMIDFFNRIADLCDLTDSERLALLDSNGISPVLGRVTIDRISGLLDLWDMLNTVLPDPTQALTWMKRPNDHPLFDGGTPLKRLSQPGGLEATIHLLNEWVEAKSR